MVAKGKIGALGEKYGFRGSKCGFIRVGSVHQHSVFISRSGPGIFFNSQVGEILQPGIFFEPGIFF